MLISRNGQHLDDVERFDLVEGEGVTITATLRPQNDEVSFVVSALSAEQVGVSLTPNSATRNTIQPSGAYPAWRVKNSVLVHQSGHDLADLPVGTIVGEVDQYGNLLLGQNSLVTTRTGNLLANGWWPDGLMYQQESRSLIVGTSVSIATVGDPPDLKFCRAGPDNNYPDNEGLGITGVLSGTSLGAARWMGAYTIDGGTPGVTLGGALQSASAVIYARATEDNRQVGAAYHQGGELYFQTTPNLTSVAVDRLRIKQDGVVSILTGGGLELIDAVNLALGTVTGSKIGTAAAQKIGFWNATPVVQPATTVAAAAFVANTSLIADDTATWDGYTIGKVVKALRTIGLLA